MEKIKVMISSTVSDLRGERDTVAETLKEYSFVELVGAEPFATASVGSNSYGHTTQLAKTCGLYILVLGHRFGFETKGGKSATEIEFDEAYKQDPTKVLVFQKNDLDTEDKQQLRFIAKVTDYYEGYWRTTFKDSNQLKEIVKKSFEDWLIQRLSIGKEITYIDHFIRIANKFKPEPDTQMLYSVTETDVQLKYKYFNQLEIIHYTKRAVYEDFWGTLSNLQYRMQNLGSRK